MAHVLLPDETEEQKKKNKFFCHATSFH